MNSTQPPQSNVASLPPPVNGFANLLTGKHEPARLTPFAPLLLPTPQLPSLDKSQVSRTRSLRLASRPAPLRIEAFLAESLRKRWDTCRAQLQICQAEFSEDAVHQLRVATRRLIAQVVLLGSVSSGPTAERARQLLKRRLKALGELRDTQVQRLFVERHTARFPELILLHDFVRNRERQLEKSVAAKVRGFKNRKLQKLIASLERHLTETTDRALPSDLLTSRVHRAVTEAFGEVVHRRRAIRTTEPGSIHRTRVAFKKFRYMVESLSPDFTGLNRRELRTLARYQRRMGMLQDLEIIQRCFTAFIEKHKGMESLLQPFRRHLHAKRARAVRSFLKSADDIFEFWPPAHPHAEPGMSAARDAA